MEREQKELLQSLMVRLAEGDRTAFDPLYSMLWPMLRGFVARALGGSADADDAAQVALMKIFSRASDFDPKRNALAWVLGVAAYECRTFRQKRRRRREAAAPDVEQPGDEPSPEEEAITRELEAALLDVMGSLPSSDADTLRAVMTGQRPSIAPATFRKRLERALGRLRVAWSSRHDLD